MIFVWLLRSLINTHLFLQNSFHPKEYLKLKKNIDVNPHQSEKKKWNSRILVSKLQNWYAPIVISLGHVPQWSQARPGWIEAPVHIHSPMSSYTKCTEVYLWTEDRFSSKLWNQKHRIKFFYTHKLLSFSSHRYNFNQTLFWCITKTHPECFSSVVAQSSAALRATTSGSTSTIDQPPCGFPSQVRHGALNLPRGRRQEEEDHVVRTRRGRAPPAPARSVTLAAARGVRAHTGLLSPCHWPRRTPAVAVDERAARAARTSGSGPDPTNATSAGGGRRQVGDDGEEAGDLLKQGKCHLLALGLHLHVKLWQSELHSLVEKPYLIGRPNSIIVPVIL